MPYDLQIADRLLRLTFHGNITSADLARLSGELADAESQSEVSLNGFADLSAAVGVNLDFDQMLVFAEKRRVTPLKNRVRTAIVAPKDIQFGFARMFQTLNTHPKVTVKVFRDAPSAMQWLDGAGPPGEV